MSPNFQIQAKGLSLVPADRQVKKQNKLLGSKLVNLAVKMVLIKTVLASVLIYQSSLLLSLVTTIHKIKALFKGFLWEGGKQIGRKLHLISWEKVAKPFSKGGLQFKNVHTQNLALGANILWNLITEKSS
jgi:hypothetical protein